MKHICLCRVESVYILQVQVHTHCPPFATDPSQSFQDILFWRVNGTKSNHLYCAYGEWYYVCILIGGWFFTWWVFTAGYHMRRPNGVDTYQSGTAFVGEEEDGTWLVVSALHCFLERKEGERNCDFTLQRKTLMSFRKRLMTAVANSSKIAY